MEKGQGGIIWEWAYDTDLPSGLIIYDIPSQTYENYSIENGLPTAQLTSVVFDPVNHRVHITGEGFYAVADEGALSGRRPEVKVTAVLPTTRDQPVLGITGDTGPSGKDTIWLEERTYIGIAGLASGLMVIGLVALHEPFKYKVVAAVAIPLFTRIKKEEVLDHETRGRIRGHIESDPGIHYNELLRKLGLNNGTLAYHLQVLEREGYIVSRNSGVYRFYFPFNMSIPAHPFRLKPVQRMMLGKIMERPGISQKELAKVTGTKRSTVNYNVKILAENGFVLLVRKGNTTECYVIDEDGKARTEGPEPGKEKDADGAVVPKGDDPA